jgi:predicted PurR-regulated permease PerM
VTSPTPPSLSPPPEPVVDAEPTVVNGATIFKWTLCGALAVVVVALGVGAVWAMLDLLVRVLIAVFLAVSFDPLVRWMIRHRIRRGRAVAIIVVGSVLIVAALAWAFVQPLVSQANQLLTDFPGYVDHLRQTSPGLRTLEARLNLRPRVDALARELPGKVAGDALSFGQRFFGALVNVLLVWVLTIYLMLDLARLRRGLVRLFPKRLRPTVSDTVTIAIEKVGAYMVGNLVVSLIAGLTAFAAFLALGVPFALPLALMVAIADLIPFVGATLAAVGSVVVAAATVEIWPNTILLALFFLVYQQVENYVIVPRIMRNSVDASALGLLFAALVGGSVMGIVGALIAIPVAATLKVVLGDRIRARDEAEDAQPSPLLIPGQTTATATENG